MTVNQSRMAIKSVNDVCEKRFHLIVGASSGLGLEFAKKMRSRKKKLILVGRNKNRLKKIKSQFPGSIFFSCDFSSSKDVISLRKELMNSKIQLDGLYLFAGDFSRKSLFNTKLMDWKYMFDSNFYPAVNAVSQLYCLFGKGAIVMVSSSVWGIVPSVDAAAYSVAKAATISLVDVFIRSLKGNRLRVYCICFKPYRTSFAQSGFSKNIKGALPHPRVAIERLFHQVLDSRKKNGVFIV